MRERLNPRTLFAAGGVTALIVGAVVVAVALLGSRRAESPPAESSRPLPGMSSGRPEEGTLVVGTPAPDFTLPAVGGGPPVRLSDRIGRRPVVLVLGSFGCAYFCGRLDEVQRLYDRFGAKAEFLFVHLDNDHREPDALRAVMADPAAPADAPVNRHARILAGLRQYDLRMSCVDDWEAKRALHAYRAFPAKVVIIDERGLVAFDSGSVVHSGLDPDGAAEWLESHTATH